MAMKIKTTKIGAGSYDVTSDTKIVHVVRNEMLGAGPQWIAAAEWDRFMMTDPMWTKREAVEQARMMLEETTK